MEEFKINDFIRVSNGVIDPDLKIDISRWTGKINSIDSECDLFEIIWDRNTLENMKNDQIEKCEKLNLDYEIMWLTESDIELVDIIKKEIGLVKFAKKIFLRLTKN